MRAYSAHIENAGIPVIRLGLNPSDELSGGAAVGGAYHPSLGELVRSRLWRDKAEAILSGIEPGADVVLGVSANRISVMTGQHRANLSYLQERFALRVGARLRIRRTGRGDRPDISCKKRRFSI